MSSLLYLYCSENPKSYIEYDINGTIFKADDISFEHLDNKQTLIVCAPKSKIKYIRKVNIEYPFHPFEMDICLSIELPDELIDIIIQFYREICDDLKLDWKYFDICGFRTAVGKNFREYTTRQVNKIIQLFEKKYGTLVHDIIYLMITHWDGLCDPTIIFDLPSLDRRIKFNIDLYYKIDNETIGYEIPRLWMSNQNSSRYFEI